MIQAGSRSRGTLAYLPLVILCLTSLYFFVPSTQIVIPPSGSIEANTALTFDAFFSKITGGSSPSVACNPKLPTTQRRSGSDKWVISYGLYGGESPRYVAAIKQTVAVHSKALFPEWTVRIYYDDSISQGTLKFLSDNGAELIKGPADVKNKMCWRFLSATDPNVERFISRDADSFLTLREKWAVDEWVKSGKKFHNMRDHPSGGHYTMMGGMWGAVRGAVPNFDPVLRGEGRQNYMVDMDIINRHVWPLLREDALQHDAFTCTSAKYRSNKPFPYPRIGWEIVGGVVINPETGATRPGDIALIANARPPAACVPPTRPLVVVDNLPGHPRIDTQCNWTFESIENGVVEGCPTSYADQCQQGSLTKQCHVYLTRIRDVFVDWNWGDGYGFMFDAELAFTPFPHRQPIKSLFERNSTGLMERVKYFSRLAHVLLPHCDTDWGFATLVFPRLRALLEKLDSDIPVLLVRTPVAEEMLLLLSKTGDFNMSRVIWHAGEGHLYYAHEMWFLVSSCNALPTNLTVISSTTTTNNPEHVVSCGDSHAHSNFVLQKDTPVPVALREISKATLFVCSADFVWLSFLQFLPENATVVDKSDSSSSRPEFLELARRKHQIYSFTKPHGR